LRAGEPHAVKAVLSELRGGSTLQGERRALLRELALLVPTLPHVDIEGFSARQSAVLGAIDQR
jgi:hypothetical protein